MSMPIKDAVILSIFQYVRLYIDAQLLTTITLQHCKKRFLFNKSIFIY